MMLIICMTNMVATVFSCSTMAIIISIQHLHVTGQNQFISSPFQFPVVVQNRGEVTNVLTMTKSTSDPDKGLRYEDVGPYYENWESEQQNVLESFV